MVLQGGGPNFLSHHLCFQQKKSKKKLNQSLAGIDVLPLLTRQACPTQKPPLWKFREWQWLSLFLFLGWHQKLLVSLERWFYTFQRLKESQSLMGRNCAFLVSVVTCEMHALLRMSSETDLEDRYSAAGKVASSSLGDSWRFGGGTIEGGISPRIYGYTIDSATCHFLQENWSVLSGDQLQFCKSSRPHVEVGNPSHRWNMHANTLRYATIISVSFQF